MVLQYFKDQNHKQQLPASKDGLIEFWLPRNTVGQTSTDCFYVYNDSKNLIEDLSFQTNNPALAFTAQNSIMPYQTVKVTVSWKSSVFEALNSSFMVKAVEVASPQWGVFEG